MSAAKREVRVVRTATGVVDRVLDVTGKSDEVVEAVMRGLLRNMDRDAYPRRRQQGRQPRRLNKGEP